LRRRALRVCEQEGMVRGRKIKGKRWRRRVQGIWGRRKRSGRERKGE